MPAVPIRSSTQDALPIEDIRDDLVVLKDGSAALILQVNAINFSLLSEKEQDAIIYAYAGLLNSLNFSIQIIIRSQKKDITGYLSLLEKAKAGQNNSLLKDLINKYQAFIRETVTQTEILDKKFYLAIPFSALELGTGQVASSVLDQFLPGKKKTKTTLNFDRVVEKAKTSLEPKRDHLIRLLGRIGLVAQQLTTNELIRLFFRVYNPDAKIVDHALTKEYTSPIIKDDDSIQKK
ncbi:MAG: TraC family protein [Candidatus Shapirobacteria bacterium]|nr:TraC family protein [Candidatus Shapirobacteria bacterium]